MGVGIGRAGRGVARSPRIHGRPGARPCVAPRLGTLRVGTGRRAIQPSKVELQMVQKDAGEVVDEAMPAGERKAELLSSESGAGRVVLPGREAQAKREATEGQRVGRRCGLWGSGREGSTRASTPAQQAPRKERKSFSSFVKELFDAQTSSSKKQDDSPERDEVPTELIFKLTRRGYGWGEEIIPQLTVERRPVKAAASANGRRRGDGGAGRRCGGAHRTSCQ